MEFRILEEFAPKLLRDTEGQRLGKIVRKIEFEINDPRFQRVGELQSEMKSTTGDFFFYGWSIRRRYTAREISDAACFHMQISATFEPAGEECGTIYDESTACPKCAAGAAQVSDLRLDLRRVPKRKDIVRTIADEWIVSQRLAELMTDAGLTGFRLVRVRHNARYEDDLMNYSDAPAGRDILARAEAAKIAHVSGDFQVWINCPENRKQVDLARKQYAEIKRNNDVLRGDAVPVWHQLIVTSHNAEIDTRTCRY